MPLYRHQPCKAVAMETVPLTAHRNGSRNGNTHRKHLKLPPEHECSGMGMSGPIGCVLDAWDQMVVLFWKAVNTWRGRCSLGEVEITLCLCPLVLVHQERKKPVSHIFLPSSCSAQAHRAT